VNVVTVTFSTAATFPDVRILEYSGIDALNPIDAAVGIPERAQRAIAAK
jgi:hypothetical protein